MNGKFSEVSSKAMIDPVCHMEVSEDTPYVYQYKDKDKTFHFCSEHCQHKFEQNPAAYLQASEAKQLANPPQEEGQYTCPMHPEIVQDRPGNCPICGMALEPVLIDMGASPSDDTELKDMQLRLWISESPLIY